MNEYVIHAKVKNNLILSRILERYPNVNAFCVAHGFQATRIGDFVNMKERAYSRRKGGWTQSALKLADALEVTVEELFTEEQAVAKLKSNEAFIEMSRQQALEMADPLRALEDSNLVKRMMEAAGLSDRQVKVLALRFKKDMTLEEVGKALDLTRERVRQIEQGALRKMRRPCVTELVEDAGVLVRGKRDSWLRDDR